MTTIVVEPAADASASETPAVADATVDAVETASDAAVEIARIEAERDVKLATISAETTETMVEAAADAAETEQDDVEWLDARLHALETAVFARMDQLQVQLTTLLEAMNALTLLSAPSNRTPPLPTETVTVETVTPETQAPNPPDDAADGRKENPVAQAARRVRKWL